MTTYLMRHGETEWNTVRRKQGRGNSPLTATGRAQARAYGDLLNQHLQPNNTIFVSPLGRAQAVRLGPIRRRTMRHGRHP